MELPSNTLLHNGKYRIIQKIGQGGFGIAYKANQISLNRIVCIKEFYFSDLCERKTNSSNITIISTSSEKIQLVNSFKKKFIKEAQRLAQFNHPNIVQVMDVFEENNTAYFTMEFIDGGSLEDLIRRDGAMNEQKAKEIITPVINAMDTVHKKDLLHLDIKPANIMLRQNQSPVLIDFGISKYLEIAKVITTTAPIGISKGYTPLEQYGGSISDFSKATDIYSLCATIYNMVTGVTPPEPLQMITSGLKSPRDLRPQLSVDFNTTILKGLSTKAIDRQQSMAQLKIAFGEDKKVAETIVKTVISQAEEVLKTATEFYNRAEKRRKTKDYLSAIKDYSEAIKKNVKNENYYFFRGLCYHELENYIAAIQDYSKVIDLNPNEDAAFYNRGLCYENINNIYNAVENFFQALKINHIDSYFESWIMGVSNISETKTLDQYLKNNWNFKDKVYFERAKIHFENQRNITAAAGDLIEAYSFNKNQEYLNYWIKTGDIGMLSEYLSNDLPNKEEVFFERGKLLFETKKDRKKSSDDFLKAYSLSKNDKYLIYWRNTEDTEMLKLYLKEKLPYKKDVYLNISLLNLVNEQRFKFTENLWLSVYEGNAIAKQIMKSLFLDKLFTILVLFIDIFLLNCIISIKLIQINISTPLFWFIAIILWTFTVILSIRTKGTILNSKYLRIFKKIHLILVGLVCLIGMYVFWFAYSAPFSSLSLENKIGFFAFPIIYFFVYILIVSGIKDKLNEYLDDDWNYKNPMHLKVFFKK